MIVFGMIRKLKIWIKNLNLGVNVTQVEILFIVFDYFCLKNSHPRVITISLRFRALVLLSINHKVWVFCPRPIRSDSVN